MIDPDKATKFSDPFDRASAFAMQMANIDKALTSIDSKLDKLTDKLDAQDKRMTALESDRRLYIAGIMISIFLSMLALGAAIWKP